MLAFASFACMGKQVGNAHTAPRQATATKATTEAGVEVTRGSSVRKGASDSAIGNAGQYRLSCRLQTHIFEEDMSKAEIKEFNSRITYRVQANLNGGGDKNLGDILDELNIPAYDTLCG